MAAVWETPASSLVINAGAGLLPVRPRCCDDQAQHSLIHSPKGATIMLGEFKKFIARGNVIDLAVGVIIGAAFGKIVTSLVEGIIMPPIGMLLGKVDFTNLYAVLDHAKGEPVSL